MSLGGIVPLALALRDGNRAAGARVGLDMKAAVHIRYGPPDVVRIAEVDKPTAERHEVLVKVHATTVNRTDCGFRGAKPFLTRLFTGLLRPRATLQGSELAGEVEAVGGGVTSFKAGDRVFGFTGFRFGAHAEYLAIPEDASLAVIPAGVTYDQEMMRYFKDLIESGAFKPLIKKRLARSGDTHLR